MNSQNQTQFMYLFERIGEPLYLSPRGGQNDIVYEVPMDGLVGAEFPESLRPARIRNIVMTQLILE